MSNNKMKDRLIFVKTPDCHVLLSPHHGPVTQNLFLLSALWILYPCGVQPFSFDLSLFFLLFFFLYIATLRESRAHVNVSERVSPGHRAASCRSMRGE